MKKVSFSRRRRRGAVAAAVERLESRQLLAAMPAFSAVAPLGSGFYSSGVTGTFNGAGQTNTYTFTVDAGQTVTVVGGGDAGLDLSLNLQSPGGGSVTANAGGAGGVEVIQTFATTSAGTYSINVSNVSGTGNYSLGVRLNAAAQLEWFGGGTNNSIATAQNIDSSFVNLGGGASRGGVIGAFPAYIIAKEDFELGDFGGGWTQYQESTDDFNDAPPPFLFYPAHQEITGKQGTAGGAYALIQDRYSRITDTSGQPVEFSLNEATWTVNLANQPTVFLNFSLADFGDDVNPFAGNFTGHAYADGIAISADGTNWKPIFSAPDQADGAWQGYTIDLKSAATAAGVSLGAGFKIRFQQYGSGYAPQGGRGWDNISLTAVNVAAQGSDYYKFTLAAGQSVSIASGSRAGAHADIRLLDSGGTVLANGKNVGVGIDEAITGFVAPSAGTYYVHVSSDPSTSGGSPYAVVVTRGANIGQELGTRIVESPQDISGGGKVLGSVGITSMNRLFAHESFSDRIQEIDPATGQVLRQFDPPIGPYFRGGLATTGKTLLFAAYPYFNGPYTVWELNPDTGQVLRSFPVTGDNIAFLDNEIFVNKGLVGSTIDVYDYETGALKRSLPQTIAVNGAAVMFASATDLYWISNDAITRIDRNTGQETSVGSIVAPGGQTNAAAVVGNELFVIDRNDGEYPFNLNAYDLDTLAFKRTIIANGENPLYFTDLGGDGGNRDVDSYSLDVITGNALTISTTTPGKSGAGSFVNQLDPAIDLFDPNGSLVATNDNGAADGRNAVIQHTAALTGKYVVRVRSVDGKRGEYFLQAGGTTAPTPPFTVVSVDPPDNANLADTPTRVTIDFNGDVLLSTINADDVKLNGQPCEDFTVVDNDTVSFVLPPVGLGTFDLSISAGAILNLRQQPLAAFTSSFRVSAKPVRPAGGLIYTHATSGRITSVGASESFRLQLDAGQLVSLAIVPSAGFRPVVQIFGPGNTLLGSHTAAAAGKNAMLQNIPVATAGDYTVTISGAANTTGTYAARILLNAAHETESFDTATNNDAASAQNLDSAFLTLLGDGRRAAVIGTLEPTPGASIASQNFEGGVIPADFTTYRSNPSIGLIQVTSAFGAGQGSNALIMRNDNQNVGPVLNEAVWDVDLSGYSNVTLNFLHGENGETETAFNGDFTNHANADGIAISDDGVNWHPVFSPPDQAAGTWKKYGVDLAAEAAKAGMTLGQHFKIKFQVYTFNLKTQWRGWDDISLTVPATKDLYKFTLAAGDTATLALTQLNQFASHVQLLGPAGQTLATGSGGASNFNESVMFTAPGSGTYYAKITGVDSAEYSLIVTKNSDLNPEPNTSMATAHDITDSHVVMGVAGYEQGRLFVIDKTSNRILEVNPQTGATLQNFVSPLSGTVGLASAGANLLIAGSADAPISEIDPDTHELIRAIPKPAVTGAIAFKNGEIFLLSDSRVYVLDYSSGRLKTQFDTSMNAGLGATADGLFGYTSFDTLYRTDTLSGIGRPLGRTIGWPNYAQGVGVIGDKVYVSNAFNQIDVFDGRTLAYQTSFNLLDGGARLGDISSDGSYNDDYYSFQATSGDTLTLATATPGGGLKEFRNTVDPVIELYDPDGVLVAIADNNAADERNAVLSWPATKSGTYKVKVFAAEGSGEYVLSVTGNHAPAPAPSQLRAGAVPASTLAITPAVLPNLVLPNEIGDTKDGQEQALTTVYSSGDSRWLAVKGQSDPIITVDEYTLDMTGRAGSKIDISLDGQNGADFTNARVDLIGPDGVSVLGSSTTSSAFAQSVLGFTIPTGGVYKLRLTTQARGQYVLSVGDKLVLDSEPNNASGQATRSLNNTRGAIGMTGGASDSSGDFYSISLVAGQTLLLSTEVFPNSTLDPKLTLFKNGQQVAGDSGSAGDGKNARIVYPVAESGTYTVQISADSGGGSYRLRSGILSASGTVWNDSNSNGVTDAPETRMASWTLYLDANNNGTKDAGEATATTDATGFYAFTDLPAGTHHVKQVLPSGYRKTLPASGIAGYDVNISNTPATGLDFGVTTNIRLAGTVFNDINNNGTQEAGEPGIAGVTVNIISNATIVATRTTDANGFWQVKGLSAGSGEADIILPPGYIATNPANGKYIGSMTSGQQNANLNFGLRKTTPAPRIITPAPEILISTYVSNDFFRNSNDALF